MNFSLVTVFHALIKTMLAERQSVSAQRAADALAMECVT